MTHQKLVPWALAFPKSTISPPYLEQFNSFFPNGIIVPHMFAGRPKHFHDALVDSLWGYETLGESFPSLANVKTWDDLSLPIPIYNVLQRSGITQITEFLQLDWETFFGLRGAGNRMVFKLAEHLMLLVIDQITSGTFWPAYANFSIEDYPLVQEPEKLEPLDFGSADSEPLIVAEVDQNVDLVKQELYKFAYYLNYRGQPEAPVAKAMTPRNLPYFSREYNELLETVTAAKWLESESIPTFTELVDRFMLSLGASDVQRIILRERIFSLNPKTLDYVGAAVELTKERVRQIEKKLLDKFEDYLESDEFLIHAIRAVKSYCSVPIQEATLSQLIPELNDVADSGIRVIDFITNFAKLEKRDEWFCNSFPVAEDNLNQAIERSSDQHSIIDGTKLTFFAGKDWQIVDRTQLTKWLQYSGYVKYKEQWTLGSRLPQLAQLVLSVENKPMSGTQILDALESDKSIKSLENSLALDDRFSRVTKSAWGLVSWGHDAYTTIKDAIEKYIDAHGSTHIDELIHNFAEKYDVSPSSIRAYAASGQFVTVDGYVSKSNAARTGRKGLTETKNLYKTDTGFAVRLTATFDRLRGSGSTCPAAVTTAYGVVQGTKKTFTTDFGDLSISFMTLTSNFTSMKKALDDLGIVEDDEFMVFLNADTASYKKLDLTKSGKELIAELANLKDSDDIEGGLITVLGLEATEGQEAIKAALKKRKEMDLLALVLEIWPEVEPEG